MVEKLTVLSHTVIIYMEIFGLKYVQPNFRYLCLNHPIKNLNLKLDDVTHGNDISMYDVAVMDNFNNVSVVVATH